MNEPAHGLTLSFDALKSGQLGVSSVYGSFLAEAASHCLRRNGHLNPVILRVTGDTSTSSNLKWDEANQGDEGTWADLQEATEYGAYGVAIIVALPLTATPRVERSAKGPGVDYWLGDSKDLRGVFQRAARLEVSGILKGSEDRGSIERKAGSDEPIGQDWNACLRGHRGVRQAGGEVREVSRGYKTVSDTREIHDRAMDLFEQGLLTARAGNSDESRRLFNQALENEAAAADSVAADHDLEPTRSILRRSAASMALRVGDVQKAKRYVDAGLAGNAPEDIRAELTALREQVLVLEAATKDYRLRAPRGLTFIQQILRRFRATAPVDVAGLARALGLAVRQAHMGSDVAGEIFPDPYHGGFSGFTIRVNADDSARLKRHTVAHEIAHFLRHRDRISNRLVDNRMYRSRLGTTREREAEELAYDLLMPRALIREFHSAGVTEPQQLAARFGVPLYVMKRRLGIKD